MMPNTYRRPVKDAIVSALRARNDVAGCWEGGSAATGRLDEFSDADLVIVAPLDAADAISLPRLKTRSQPSAKFRIDGTSIHRRFETWRSVFISWLAIAGTAAVRRCCRDLDGY
jgi:predicted nucleotidyltransferase